MIAHLSFSKSEYKESFFQRQSADKMILEVGLLSSIGHILSVDYILNVGCRSKDGGILG